MIIQQGPGTNRAVWGKLAAFVMAFAALGALVWVFFRDRGAEEGLRLYTDMEVVKAGADGVKLFVGKDGVMFGQGETQSDKQARSGKFSSLLNEKSAYGGTYHLDKVHAGDEFRCTVWRYSPKGVGTVVADGSWKLYVTATVTGKKDYRGWEELAVTVKVPDDIREGKLKFYLYNPDADEAYFDDLEIVMLDGGLGEKPQFKPGDSLPSVNLVINDKDMAKLQSWRDEAMRQGLIRNKEMNWVKVRLEEGKKEWRGALRLKGDWTDHLEGQKWSFRIELMAGQAWRRMKTFSFQNPKTRSWLDEWVYHEWLAQEDLMSPRYDFVELRVNGLSWGVYAYEEHFNEELVEHHGRPSGPIMKFNEEGFWEIVERSLKNNVWYEGRVPYVEASTIDAFGMKGLMSKKSSKQDFLAAQNLMLAYQTKKKDVDEVFDMDKLARYYALSDILQAYHGLVWHNQRFYYNPVLSKLEPIGFDGYTADGPYKWLQRPFMGHGRNARYMNADYKELMFARLFEDEEFLGHYVPALFKYSDPEYIKAFYARIERGLYMREAWMRKEWRDYAYSAWPVFEEARLIRQTLYPMRTNSVKGYREGKFGLSYRYTINNYHCLPVRVLGVGNTPDLMEKPFKEQVLLASYVAEYPAEAVELEAGMKADYLFYAVPGIDSVFSTVIQAWEAPTIHTDANDLFDDLKLVSNAVYKVDSSKRIVEFQRGKHSIKNTIPIPKGWTVNIYGGTELDFTEGAGFVSKSPVNLLGTAESPVAIVSSDRSGLGFTVLQAEGKCMWRHVVFDGLKTLNGVGWKQSGSVLLYESDVSMQHCKFVNMQGKDALALVRTVFYVADTYIGYAVEDGIDLDASNGSLVRCYVYKAGMDGIECSGSTVKIADSKIEYAGESGLNVGMESRVALNGVAASYCRFGLGVKDLSEVSADRLALAHNETALVAYQEKAEYGPAKILLDRYELRENGKAYLLQNGSELHKDGSVVVGKL